MKTHRKNILKLLIANRLAGNGLSRDFLELSRKTCGIHFDRRIREIAEQYPIKKIWSKLDSGKKFISAWFLDVSKKQAREILSELSKVTQ